MSKEVVLTVAGSDSGGGAGIQADLKTFQSLGVFGTSAITAVTAQNTSRVMDVKSLEGDFVSSQIDAVANDMNITALKTGMLANEENVHIVSKKITQYNFSWCVIDPVLVATSGDVLLTQRALETVKEQLVPKCDIITPNLPETEILTGIKINGYNDIEKAAMMLRGQGAGSVLIKGGHGKGEAVDYLFYDQGMIKLTATRIGVGSLHGTGCTLSAAICAYLGQGYELISSVDKAKKYITKAIKNSFVVGEGSRVLSH
ncbi:bifunctional hydroxymethylpyrimidine kinase/phosphomethylpyrimidine kinase [Natranaerobius trueperi]|uniref:Hydroxymethylpyrimidine/phosphomethylpyrimidine kinase n=1 Tax=Natranaerobius trueperi TaxID=759412 RepID=A0A226C2F1_9FIRM|nr:bifunctional hydroxymethylpyrimidine kinase/phosphomethylpyrimidine kinase [Natranaerobius trueperi]OWZ84619.1 bifunctional hydroxymethylpyrimidine kinase/phosphomethylpyrimidine kinase [Natranaerobius trueperi]